MKESRGWRLTGRIGEVLRLRIYRFGILYTSYPYYFGAFWSRRDIEHMVRFPLALISEKTADM
jgi:hypothetical protein